MPSCCAKLGHCISLDLLLHHNTSSVSTMHSSLSLSTPTRLRRSKRLAQTCTYEDDGTASLNSAQRAVSLPASKTVFLLRDDSPLENLLSCSDFVTFTESHGRNVEPRVLISRNAKALWHEGPEFAFVVRSIVRFLDIKYIAPSPTVCTISVLPVRNLTYPQLSYPVVLKLSSFVKNQLGIWIFRQSYILLMFFEDYLQEKLYQLVSMWYSTWESTLSSMNGRS